METRKHRKYTEEERSESIADVRELGVAGAAEKHGIPAANVSRWAAAAGVKPAERARLGKAKATAPRSTTTTTRSTEAKAIEPTVKSVPSVPTAPALERAPAPAAESAPAAPTAESAPAAPAAKRVLRARIAKVYTPSQKAEAVEYASAHGVTAASTKFDISRFSIYDWRNKCAKAAKGEGPSPTSGPAPKEIEATRDREILAEWHKHPGLGPSQIRNQLRRGGIKVAVHTVRRVMEDAGYRPPKVKREGHDERYEAVRPNHLWHLDFVQRHINLRGRP